MIICEVIDSFTTLPILQWSDQMFVLAATCTATVSAALNLGLMTSAVLAGASAKHPITMQLCICGVIACASLTCHVRHVWLRAEHGSIVTYPVPCRTLDLATLFSHSLFVCLVLLDLRQSRSRVVLGLLSLISWCVVGLVSLAAGISCSSTSAVLVFCFYVLHVPLMILLIVNHRSSRLVAPLGAVVAARQRGVKRIAPQVFLLLLGTVPQAFLVAAEALKTRPFPRADAWCCLAIAVASAFRPLVDAVSQPDLGDAVADLIGSLCRRKAPP